MYDDIGYYGQDSPFWAYNQPGWKPRCVRCSKRTDTCKKFNSEDLGSFAGEWICADCKTPTDTFTPYERIFENKK
jgi:hypothetical protein